jgi:hypothetical protein
MHATRYRLYRRNAPARSQPLSGDVPVERSLVQGPWTAATRRSPAPRFRLSWIKLAAWSGLLLLSLFLWWVILRTALALIALVR